MLNKLQNHVEQEEIRWRHESEALESQVQTLKEELTLSENEKEKVNSCEIKNALKNFIFKIKIQEGSS